MTASSNHDNEADRREERDSLGVVHVPAWALWGAQTQRAVDNFGIARAPMPAPFIRALGLVKWAAAGANAELGLMRTGMAIAIQSAALEVADNRHDAHFPVDVLQTGSGTSSNMNANEVIARLASEGAEVLVHPNDHVNMSQSSNDVIPTCIAVSTAEALRNDLLPALRGCIECIERRSEEFAAIVKTGRTHLMDAMPITVGQEFSAWAAQLAASEERCQSLLPRVCAIAQGGTAVGTGINAHPKFGAKVAVLLSEQTGNDFLAADNSFAAIAGQEASVEAAATLKVIAVTLMKIANDLRWLSSGPLNGLAELQLPALQPGSSIMPGKVNPVIPEAVAMAAAKLIGNEATVTVAAQSGNLQLNVMLPLIGATLLDGIGIATRALQALHTQCLAGLTVNSERLAELSARNPVLVTALNPVIGYELGAKIAKEAYASGRPVRDVALELTDLDADELDRLLDPLSLTRGGIQH
ncbi:MAG: class II fumarate hydratase [Pseudomonadota bacterium]